jgi:hypothetical protein
VSVCPGRASLILIQALGAAVTAHSNIEIFLVPTLSGYVFRGPRFFFCMSPFLEMVGNGRDGWIGKEWKVWKVGDVSMRRGDPRGDEKTMDGEGRCLMADGVFGVIPSRVARKRLISSEEGEEDEARDSGILLAMFRSLFGCLTRSHNFWQRECPKLVGSFKHWIIAGPS